MDNNATVPLTSFSNVNGCFELQTLGDDVLETIDLCILLKSKITAYHKNGRAQNCNDIRFLVDRKRG